MEPINHMSMSVDSGGGGDRFPQWSVQETRDLLMIRGELDPTFMETKRNKLLWEVISTKMKERGYNRSADQCKCKWKNLVTRYKGFESTTMEQAAAEAAGVMRQQFPFYNELQAIFSQRMEAAGSSSKKRMLSSDDDEESKMMIKKKKSSSISSKDNDSNLKVEILEELMKQQMDIEMKWMGLYEKKEEERRMREMEWRLKMEALENERMMFDRRWREREEETRMKQETRSEKRDALITLLLNNLNITPQPHP